MIPLYLDLRHRIANPDCKRVVSWDDRHPGWHAPVDDPAWPAPLDFYDALSLARRMGPVQIGVMCLVAAEVEFDRLLCDCWSDCECAQHRASHLRPVHDRLEALTSDDDENGDRPSLNRIDIALCSSKRAREDDLGPATSWEVLGYAISALTRLASGASRDAALHVAFAWQKAIRGLASIDASPETEPHREEYRDLLARMREVQDETARYPLQLQADEVELGIEAWCWNKHSPGMWASVRARAPFSDRPHDG